MHNTAIAVDLDEALDVECNITAKVAFYNVGAFDFVTKLRNVILGKILCADVGIYSGLCKDILSALRTNTVNVGKCGFHSFVVGKVNTGNTSPISILPFLF